MSLFFQGEFDPAQRHLEQGMSRYQPERYRASVVDRNRLAQGPIFAAQSLWYLGYPDQALRRSGDAVALGQELMDPRSLSYAFGWAAVLHQLRRERIGIANALFFPRAAPAWPPPAARQPRAACREALLGAETPGQASGTRPCVLGSGGTHGPK